jgi:hypothetical protein
MPAKFKKGDLVSLKTVNTTPFEHIDTPKNNRTKVYTIIDIIKPSNGTSTNITYRLEDNTTNPFLPEVYDAKEKEIHKKHTKGGRRLVRTRRRSKRRAGTRRRRA